MSEVMTAKVIGIYGRNEESDEDMPRRRLQTVPVPGDSEKPEKAMFIPVHGLVGHEFYHVYHEEEEYDEMEERAVLVQSLEHYTQIMQDEVIGHNLIKKIDPEEKMSNQERLERIIQEPTFGEQLLVSGCDATQVAVGDVFEVEGGVSPLKLEVTSPRKPCCYVDRKHGAKKGSKGLCVPTRVSGTAGWFCRVLVAGELCDGMQLVRTSNPHPKWNLSFLSKAVFGEGKRMQVLCGIAHWERDLSLLRELCGLSQLGNYEWADELESVLEKKEEEEAKQQTCGETKDLGGDDESSRAGRSSFKATYSLVGAFALAPPLLVYLGKCFLRS